MNALYVGSFDPITIGHIDIIKRAAKLFDTLYVHVGVNSSKSTMIDYNYREHFVKLAIANIPNVKYLSVKQKSTTPDLMKDNNIMYLVRGARNVLDLVNEQALYMDYRKIDPNIEEVLLWAHTEVSSSFIRECIMYGKDDLIKQYVPGEIYEELINYRRR